MHEYGAYKHSETLRFLSILFKECHASSVTPYTIYYQSTHCGGVALTVLLQVEEVEQTSENTVVLHSLDYTKKHLNLQLKHPVVITLVY
jgi:hypothetical protein